MGGDCPVAIGRQLLGVSIHAPAWGATTDADYSSLEVSVSIHAPAWGATADGAVFGISLIVSIHAPAWGATVFFQ